MKIALINSEYPSLSGTGHGGIATYTYTCANALASQGQTVYVLAREGTVPDALDSSVQFRTFGSRRSSGFAKYTDRLRNGNIVWEEGYARGVRDTLLSISRKGGLDIAEFPEYGGLAYACKGTLPFKVVINLHTPSELVDDLNQIIVTRKREIWHIYERKALLQGDAFRSPSEALRDEVCRRYGLTPLRIKIIRNPISTDLFDNIAYEGAGPDRIDILFAGRLECRKGAEILLKAIKSVLRIDKRIHMTFAGETEFGDALDYRNAIERALDIGERERVWFLGPVNHQELPMLYRRSSIFLMPSVFENAPYSLMEAMAAHLPVVGARTSGIAEIISDNINGKLFAPDDTDSLLACIAELIRDPAKATAMANRAYEDVCACFAPEKIALESIAFYTALLQNG